jgi:hypothetical protein
MKGEVHKTKVDTRNKLLELIMEVLASIKESQYALRRPTQHVLTPVATYVTVDVGIFEDVLYWLNSTNVTTSTINTIIGNNK